jgi:hypothetical protein
MALCCGASRETKSPNGPNNRSYANFLSGTERIMTKSPDDTETVHLGPMPLWVRLIVILGALLTFVGAVIALAHPAMLVSPHDEINRAVQIYAGYMAARNLALAFMLIALLVVGARRSLGNLMVLVGLIQLLDGCMDVYEGRWVVVPGVLIFGLIFLIGATRLSDGNPFWKLRAWIH